MIDHIGVTVSDFAKSRSFYEAALKPLGYNAGFTDEKAGVIGFFGRDKTSIWVSKGKPKNKSHIAIRSSDRDKVKKFHKAALKAAGVDNGKPGIRPQYGKTYYAAFVLDPDGHNLEAVCYAKPKAKKA